MTNDNGPLDAVIGAFLDHLDGDGEAPSLEHLSPEARVRAEALMASMMAGRGIDPYASRPSIERLLAGTSFEKAIRVPQLSASFLAPVALEEEIRDQLRQDLPMSVMADVASTGSAGARSDFLVLVSGLRLRVQVHKELTGPAQLADLDPAETAGPIYGRFPDTTGVILLYPDGDLSSVIIDPFDIEHCIEAPSGAIGPPRTRRLVMSFREAVHSYIDELAPALDPLPGSTSMRPPAIDVGELAVRIATEAVQAIVSEGIRARIAAKRDTWGALGERDVAAVSRLVLACLDQPLGYDELEQRISMAANTA